MIHQIHQPFSPTKHSRYAVYQLGHGNGTIKQTQHYYNSLKYRKYMANKYVTCLIKQPSRPLHAYHGPQS